MLGIWDRTIGIHLGFYCSLQVEIISKSLRLFRATVLGPMIRSRNLPRYKSVCKSDIPEGPITSFQGIKSQEPYKTWS